MTGAELLAIHQLLGRLVYFHVLFVEPALDARVPPATHAASPRSGTEAPETVRLACDGVPGAPAVAGTAWSAIAEIAARLPGSVSGDLAAPSCPACHVRLAGAAVAGCWIDVEDSAYAVPPVLPLERMAWSSAVGRRLGAAFAAEMDVPCMLVSRDLTPPALQAPSAGRMPLTAELLALWVDPTGAAPVSSWLNHCTSLDDITRIVGGEPA